ncbi:MAG: hypothetical protein RLP44_32835 [Aggregatilineales bacterium]
MKKHVCILAFSPILRDARVLRQIEYLHPHYDLTVIGYGEPHPDWQDKVEWVTIDRGQGIGRLLSIAFWLVLGRLWNGIYDYRFRTRRQNREAYEHAVKSGANAFLANDWSTLPIAVRAAQTNDAKVVFDAHEYGPLQDETFVFRILMKPQAHYVLKKYSLLVDRSLTVCYPIAERYKKEYGLNPAVIMSAPKRQEAPISDVVPDRIRLIHHGYAMRRRQPEKMIEIVEFLDNRFELYLMFLGDQKYITSLKTLANKIAKGRVYFIEPVSPENIVETIAKYDIGVVFLPPTTYNLLMALPNKLFDAVNANLAIFTGASPSIKEIIERYNLGVVSPSFEIMDAAKTLNALTTQQIITMKQNAREASKVLNADVELSKLVTIYRELIG